jgi:hypothetical protein
MAAKKGLTADTARKRLLSLPPEERAALLRHCGDWRHPVRHMLINDMAPQQYGKRFKCHAPAMMDIALRRLEKMLGT